MKCPHTEEVKTSFRQFAEGSEHCVYLDDLNGLVFKTTKPGLFGENYYLSNGRIAQRNCSPFDYLVRLRLWQHLFDSAPKPLGLTTEGQIVSSHEFITGSPPDQSELDAFLETEGFTPVRQQYWLWQKSYSSQGFALGLGDARADNFVKSPEGIVPIDVRLWISPEERLRDW